MQLLALMIDVVLATQPVLRATIPVKNVAVLAIAPRFPPTNKPALLATTFAVGSHEPVQFVPAIDSLTNGSSAKVETIEDEVKWTNDVGMVPAKAVPGSDGSNFMLTAGGFLVPGKTTGSVDLWSLGNDPTKPVRTKLSTDKKDWFFHKALWYDINGDGRQDVLAARATAPTSGGKKAGELIWLEQPPDFDGQS